MKTKTWVFKKHGKKIIKINATEKEAYKLSKQLHGQYDTYGTVEEFAMEQKKRNK